MKISNYVLVLLIGAINMYVILDDRCPLWCAIITGAITGFLYVDLKSKHEDIL